jgi:hypothetical protein
MRAPAGPIPPPPTSATGARSATRQHRPGAARSTWDLLQPGRPGPLPSFCARDVTAELHERDRAFKCHGIWPSTVFLQWMLYVIEGCDRPLHRDAQAFPANSGRWSLWHFLGCEPWARGYVTAHDSGSGTQELTVGGRTLPRARRDALEGALCWRAGPAFSQRGPLRVARVKSTRLGYVSPALVRRAICSRASATAPWSFASSTGLGGSAVRYSLT